MKKANPLKQQLKQVALSIKTELEAGDYMKLALKAGVSLHTVNSTFSEAHDRCNVDVVEAASKLITRRKNVAKRLINQNQ